MDWPATPVEHWSGFRPQFCPWRDCAEHLRREPGYRFHRHAAYATQRRKRVARFRCLACRRTFSTQTFSVTYYRKRPELLRHVAAGIVAGSALRQIARSLDCSKTTVCGIAARLGRHAMLLHARSLESLRGKLEEGVAFDHFETFEFTQDYPFGVGTAVGSRSWFVYALDPAPHGRTGRRSDAQARRLRARPKRASRGRYAGSTRRTLDLLVELASRSKTLELTSDGHPDYVRALRLHPQRHRVRLRAFPNPSRGVRGTKRSSAAVARDRAMFPVDLLHKILRHTLAHHRRQTIAFTRRLNAAMERLSLAAVWRNFVKARSERKSRSPTPAQSLGLTESRWSWKRVLSKRLFYDRVRLPEPWPTLYRRNWETPVLQSNALHRNAHNF